MYFSASRDENRGSAGFVLNSQYWFRAHWLRRGKIAFGDPTRELGAVVETQSVVAVLETGLDRALAPMDSRRDLLIAEPLGRQPGHLRLTVGERIEVASGARRFWNWRERCVTACKLGEESNRDRNPCRRGETGSEYSGDNPRGHHHGEVEQPRPDRQANCRDQKFVTTSSIRVRVEVGW
jgi:hypothetical protein